MRAAAVDHTLAFWPTASVGGPRVNFAATDPAVPPGLPADITTARRTTAGDPTQIPTIASGLRYSVQGAFWAAHDPDCPATTHAWLNIWSWTTGDTSASRRIFNVTPEENEATWKHYQFASAYDALPGTRWMRAYPVVLASSGACVWWIANELITRL